MSEIAIAVGLGGGLELIFRGRQKEFTTTVRAGMTLGEFVVHLRDGHVVERKELFVVGDKIRPGILVLVNDVDWELLGEEEYLLQNKDKVVLISTLHGG